MNIANRKPKIAKFSTALALFLSLAFFASEAILLNQYSTSAVVKNLLSTHLDQVKGESAFMETAEREVSELARVLGRRFRDPTIKYENPKALLEDKLVRSPSNVGRSPETSALGGEASLWTASEPMTESRARRMLITAEAVVNYGKAWRLSMANTYFISKDNDAALYWPGHERFFWVSPDSTDHTKLDFYQEQLALKTLSPKWSRPYVDAQSGEFMVTVFKPVYEGEELLGVVGRDWVISSLLELIGSTAPNGTKVVLFRENGDLVSHPDYNFKIKSSLATVNMREEPKLKELYDAVIASGEGVIDYAGGKLVASKLQASGWYKALIVSDASITERKGVMFWLLAFAFTLHAVFAVGFVSLTYSQATRPVSARKSDQKDDERLAPVSTQTLPSHLQVCMAKLATKYIEENMQNKPTVKKAANFANAQIEEFAVRELSREGLRAELKMAANIKVDESRLKASLTACGVGWRELMAVKRAAKVIEMNDLGCDVEEIMEKTGYKSAKPVKKILLR